MRDTKADPTIITLSPLPEDFWKNGPVGYTNEELYAEFKERFMKELKQTILEAAK